MEYDAVVIGGGIAGLTAAAISQKPANRSCCARKRKNAGDWLIPSSVRDFSMMGEFRALENAGVLFPMLRQLGISLDFVP